MEATLRTLRELARTQGIELWLVGGFIRDTLLGRTSLDADLVLRDAVPFARQVARVLHGAFVLLDDRWGTARVVFKRGRLPPLELDFAELRGGSLAEDLACRDFTLNAIACALPEFLDGPDRPLTDPFHGAADLKAGIIRAVSPGALQADPLRVVRAYRLAAQCGFTLEPNTRALARAAAPRLAEVSAERITAELFKLLSAPHGAGPFRELAAEGMLATVLPEAPGQALAAATAALTHLEKGLENLAEFLADTAERVVSWLETGSHRPLLKWATLWDGLIDRAGLQSVALRLKLSREQQRLWQTLAASRSAPRAVLLRAVTGSPSPHTRAILGRHFRRNGEAGMGAVLVQWAHLRAGCAEGAAEALAAAARSALRLFVREIEPILQGPRLLTGEDLQRELHLSPGPPFQGLLATALQAEVLGQITTREEALAWVQRRIGQRE